VVDGEDVDHGIARLKMLHKLRIWWNDFVALVSFNRDFLLLPSFMLILE